MNEEKIKAILTALEGVKYYEWKTLYNVITQKYNSESQRVTLNTCVEDSESLKKLLLMEFNLLGNNLNH